MRARSASRCASTRGPGRWSACCRAASSGPWGTPTSISRSIWGRRCATRPARGAGIGSPPPGPPRPAAPPRRRRHWLGVVGRLAPGATAEGAQRDLAAISAQMAREHPESDAGHTAAAVSLRDSMVGDTRAPLILLMASAGLVLLITCANLAAALLSRTLSRRQELAVRVALGARRERLVRQLLTESVRLAAAGGVVGVGLAALGLAVLHRLAPPSLPAYAV